MRPRVRPAELGVDIASIVCAEWAHAKVTIWLRRQEVVRVVMHKTIGVPAPRVVPSPNREEVNETADRLVLEVVSAVDDGYTGVPECQRLIAWLTAEFLPFATSRFSDEPVALVELRGVLDEMHGSHGETAARLSLQARSLIFRLL